MVTIDNKTVSYEVYFNSKDANKESALGDVWLAHNDVTELDELNNGNTPKPLLAATRLLPTFITTSGVITPLAPLTTGVGLR